MGRDGCHVVRSQKHSQPGVKARVVHWFDVSLLLSIFWKRVIIHYFFLYLRVASNKKSTRWKDAARHLVAVTSAEEDLDGQPVMAADLEAAGLVDLVNLGNLLIGQAPAIKVKVGLDALLGDALGKHAPALLDTPLEENLLHSLALGLSDLGEGLVLVERRVAATEGRVAGAVNALGCAVLDEVGGGVARVELDLVDGGDDLCSLC